jgi:hypothetical protein
MRTEVALLRVTEGEAVVGRLPLITADVLAAGRVANVEHDLVKGAEPRVAVTLG